MTVATKRRPGRPDLVSRWLIALLAGAIAILLNTAALAAADLVQLPTAHGGLLRLLQDLLGGLVRLPSGRAFQTGFHIVVGLGMALFYAFVLAPILPGRSWVKGAIYALAVWLANAVIVLPVTGEGFAGSRSLSLAGMAWFAAVHTLFFVVQAVLYHHLCQIWLARRPAAS
ncbi:MAG TPA: hypothetical protein VM639_15910 [Dongiaceae bacterium]|nr:hypothetical protein [Dongiaceae bacterium]